MINKLKPYTRAIWPVLLVASFIAGWTVNGWRIGSQHAEAEKAAYEKSKQESIVRLQKQEKIANEAKQEQEQAVADARAASDLSKRLQQHINELNRSHNTATTGGCETTRDTAVLYAELFRRADERAGELAEYADRARIAGQACERSYDALGR